jgi:hypothetical protein
VPTGGDHARQAGSEGEQNNSYSSNHGFSLLKSALSAARNLLLDFKNGANRTPISCWFNKAMVSVRNCGKRSGGSIFSIGLSAEVLTFLHVGSETYPARTNHGCSTHFELVP